MALSPAARSTPESAPLLQEPLEPGREYTGRAERGQVHTYPFRLGAGQFARIVVTRLSGELHYRIASPSGKLLVHNQQTFFTGSYDTFVVGDADAAGEGRRHTLSIHPQAALPGSYRVKLEEIRPAAPADELRLRAQAIRQEFDIPDHLAADAPLREALALLRRAGEERGALVTMLEILQNSRWISRQRHDRGLCEEAIALAHKLRDRYAEAEARAAMGVILSDWNEKARALDELEKAVALSTELNDAAGQIRSLNLSASLLSLLGQDERALAIYRRTVALARDAGIEVFLAGALFGAGSTLHSLGKAAEALPLLEEAQALYRKQPQRSTNEAMLLMDLASIAESGQQMSRAFELTTEALAMAREVKNSVAAGHALRGLARLHGLNGEWTRTIPLLEQGVALARASPVGLYLSDSLAGLARAYWELGDAARALPYIRESLEIVEAAVARSGGIEAQVTYFPYFRNQYSLLAAILRLAGDDAGAFEVSERSRARGLAARLSSMGVDLRAGVSGELLRQSAGVEKAIAGRLNDRAELDRRAHQQSEAAAVQRDIDDLRHRQDRILARIRAAHPNYASLTQFAGVSAARVREELLDEDTVLIEYLLERKRNFVWAVTREGVTGARIVRREEVDRAAQTAYESLTARNLFPQGETAEQRRVRIERAEAAWEQAASRLSELLLKPVAPALAGKKRWLVVSDETLHHVPFSALPSPGPGAPAAREVVNLPSAAVLSMIRQLAAGRKTAPRSVAIFADPVFEEDDERLARPVARPAGPAPGNGGARSPDEIRGKLRLPRLPFTRREAVAIVELAPLGSTRLAAGFAATRAAAHDAGLADYRVVHFATHGILDEEAPELSGIALSMFDSNGRPQNGFLRLHDLYQMKLPVDLVVLSACQSALGKRFGGEGLVGLTRGMMYAGAARVVASLWKVDDAATAELMRLFYYAMLREGRTPAASLFAAQRQMAAQRRWSSPYYWAAFQLHGEYK